MTWQDDAEFVAWQQRYVRRVGYWIVPFTSHLYEAWKASRESDANLRIQVPEVRGRPFGYRAAGGLG